MSGTNQYTVDELVPHSGQMSLLDRVVSHSAESLSSEVDIHASTLFADKALGVPAWVGLEYMAQSVAAWAGVLAKASGGEVRLGFLLGARKYDASISHFPLGSTLTIYAERAYQQDDLGVFDCTICIDSDVEVATARLNVYQPSA